MINVHEELRRLPDTINPEAVKSLIERAQTQINYLQELCAAAHQRLTQINVMEFEDEVHLYRLNGSHVEYRVEAVRFEKGKPGTRFWPSPQAYGFDDFVSFTLAQSFSHQERRHAIGYAVDLARHIHCPVIVLGFELRKTETALIEGVDVVFK